ncbi:odorant receptor 4-like [Anoplolepis gracilipes]|uniref:odorant receptor 4-like n=1 Tax=Anoplolepis gracilipes TaxID=354296 RepID=UPI003BA0888F
MPQNKHHQDDILYITQPTRNILLALGAWPSIDRKRSVRPQACNFLLICIVYILLSCDLIPGILYWLREKSTRIRLQTIPLLLYDIMSVSQYGIFIFRSDQLRRCFKHVEEDWENVISADIRNIMLKSAKTGKRLAIICAIFMYTGAFTFRTILPLSQGKTYVTEQNITIRPLACPGYFFSLNVYVSPVYEILFTIQCLTGFVMVSIVISACGLTATFVVHACGQLKILIGLMTRLVQEPWQEETEVDRKLAQIVKHQVRVRNFLQLVQHTLQEIFLMEIMVNTIDICLLLYFMIVDWQNRNIAVLCTYLLSITNVVTHMFIFCYTGEQLTGQAEKVAIVSCELEWYRLPNRKARSVILLMIMSNRPTKISAGKFVDLSLKTFGDVMKTSGAYFNMLRNVIE